MKRTALRSDPGAIPLAPKLAYTLFVAVLVPVYWTHHGPTHFLWLSDVALLLITLALWRGSRLLVSTVAVAALAPELGWNLDFFSRLLAGRDLLGLNGTAYMFDPAKPLYLRALSLFHVFLPLVILWLLWRLGYDRRALPLAILLSWAVLIASYLVTDPAKNINWVFGWGKPPHSPLPAPLHLAAMLLMAVAVCLLTHITLRRLLGVRNGESSTAIDC